METQVTPVVLSMRKDYRWTLDLLMERWRTYHADLIRDFPGRHDKYPDHSCDEDVYSFAYWLLKHSGLARQRQDDGTPETGWSGGYEMNVSVKFEPRDIWLGVFWTRRASAWASERGWLDIYVCFVPCLPVKISWFVGTPKEES